MTQYNFPGSLQALSFFFFYRLLVTWNIEDHAMYLYIGIFNESSSFPWKVSKKVKIFIILSLLYQYFLVFHQNHHRNFFFFSNDLINLYYYFICISNSLRNPSNNHSQFTPLTVSTPNRTHQVPFKRVKPRKGSPSQ